MLELHKQEDSTLTALRPASTQADVRSPPDYTVDQIHRTGTRNSPKSSKDRIQGFRRIFGKPTQAHTRAAR